MTEVDHLVEAHLEVHVRDISLWEALVVERDHGGVDVPLIGPARCKPSHLRDGIAESFPARCRARLHEEFPAPYEDMEERLTAF